jgi:signal transduction protein with GAF and PtsI domain
MSARVKEQHKTVDGQLVARTVGELRATLPRAGDLLAGLGRVVEATRTVVGVDGTGLTLAHEDGRPRWVAVSDAAMELLEQVQHDFGEGPCLAAFAQDRVVAVQDLHRELVWDRLAAVVGQLQVRGVLSVPVRLASQPVGTLDVYATQPRAWTPGEVEALGALAVVTAELVSTAVELANREVEVAQLRQALASRVWIEQAKGVLVTTRGVSPDAAFQQLRKRARSSSRKLADLAQEVVQEAQRERIAALAIDDARVRAAETRARKAEARAREAEQTLQAGQTGLARRAAALDRARDDLDERERAADQRNHLADERERAADQRNHLADERDRTARDSE